MNPYLAVLLLLGLIVVGWRFTRRKPRAETTVRAGKPERRIEGFLVWSPLHAQMGRGCIADHGTKYGAGFRRKEGPALPHDPYCRCEAIPFSVAGSQVLEGALQRTGVPRCLQPGFPAAAIVPTIAALKRINAEPAPADANAYLALAGVESFDEPVREAVAAFLRERYAFLASQEGAPRTEENNPGEREGSEFDSAAAKAP